MKSRFDIAETGRSSLFVQYEFIKKSVKFQFSDAQRDKLQEYQVFRTIQQSVASAST
jgi:hypothetical protein